MGSRSQTHEKNQGMVSLTITDQYRIPRDWVHMSRDRDHMTEDQFTGQGIRITVTGLRLTCLLLIMIVATGHRTKPGCNLVILLFPEILMGCMPALQCGLVEANKATSNVGCLKSSDILTLQTLASSYCKSLIALFFESSTSWKNRSVINKKYEKTYYFHFKVLYSICVVTKVTTHNEII